ncbi:hypothetical protein [Massilimicrobiota timonensis]|uniref:hypothetical protein n=1 Tax=Massilimicrobiota timonensis TaxID=1776392 RepID=UPI00101D93EB|nr:hypothetical protein [Massilimicrobiota timonensis]
MTIVFNLLCKAFIAILDILILDFYLKSIYPDIYYEKFKRIYFIFYIAVFFIITLFIGNNILYISAYIIIFILLFIVYSFYHINKLDFTKKLIIFFVSKIFIQIIITFIFSWLFNTLPVYTYSNYSFSYTILNSLISYYIIYSILTIYTKNKYINIKQFKILTVFIFLGFPLILILDNPTLFKLISIARTYIFTVVISIIALICFDRMQTKYEKDKHLQESIIQNLEKEKEFNQQR